MSPQSAVLVESVAQALEWAISDPVGHSSWNETICRNSGAPNSKRRRGVEETKQAATVFDSSSIPPVSIQKYLMRLSATFRCSDATFIAALVVVDRLLEYDGGRLPLTMQNVHRVFLASLVVATKYHEDLVYSNSHYAKAGGVHLREVNRLERVLLAALDFDLRIEPEQYRQYEATLLNLCASSNTSMGISGDLQLAPEKPIEPSESAAEGRDGGLRIMRTSAFVTKTIAQGLPKAPQIIGTVVVPCAGEQPPLKARGGCVAWQQQPQGPILGFGMSMIVTAGSAGELRCHGRASRTGSRQTVAGFGSSEVCLRPV